MASKLPDIGRPNFIAIAGMIDKDVFQVREYYIVCLVKAGALKDKDTTEVCIDWIVALTSEMRQRTPAALGTHTTPDMPRRTKGIAQMGRGELFKAREMHIVKLVDARRKNDSDVMVESIKWILAFTEEMRLRSDDTDGDTSLPGLPQPPAVL